MNPAKGGTTAGGFTYPRSIPAHEGHPQKDLDGGNKFASDSGAVDSGYLSGQCLSSCEFTSSSSVDIPEERPVEQRFHHSQQDKPQQTILAPVLEDDSHTLDSGVDLDSSQQSESAMRVKPMNDLAAYFAKMNVSSYAQPVKPETYYLQNKFGDTYLHLAVLREATEVVKLLVQVALKPSWLNIQNDMGRTPLHLAVLSGQKNVVRLLVQSGAIPVRDDEGNTPLHLACLYHRLECAYELLEPLNNNLEEWNYNGKRCVHIAAEASDIDMLRLLINAGADINSKEGTAGYTPLHIAIDRLDEKLVQFLLEECPKLRLEQTTYAGLTAYQLAAHNQTLLSRLRSRGAEPLTPPESDYEDSDDSEEDEK
ncbi:NF-kappa-B inhibitor cactus-like isoform X2 [Uranotaenia lowii]|nr:NF-kappa-B inhibitor cactus-like isoform X2 [Uranotaenia lowii]